MENELIIVDLLRAGITITPVVFFFLNRASFTTLVVSSILRVVLGTFFEPFLQSVVPIAAKDVATPKVNSGLMSTTIRLARVMGPALIRGISAVVATIHFFESLLAKRTRERAWMLVYDLPFADLAQREILSL